MKALAKVGLVALAVWADCAPRSAVAQSFCDSCEVQVGLGGTYHYWGATGSMVLPVSLTWSDNRYEFAAFRFTSEQLLRLPGTHEQRHMADPYWGASLSRRWQLFRRGPVQGFFGFGVSLKTESDTLSVSRWDFASQLGLRFRLHGDRVVADLAMRHWSNGGIRLPNHGQDFATLTVRLNSGLFGVSDAEQIPVDPALSADRLLAAQNAAPEGPLLP
ncbi:MAG: acyloxyacyl hydrolase [Terriglobales bacterium]